ncbi:MAG TPA: hypothetical protein VK939_13565 [Longimicrobiales bacterium]|nr:hypothetical protein [Longimicrobiales bacterium]
MLLLLVAAPAVHGQGFRGTATTTVRYLELRPMLRDTVSRERVTEQPDGTLLFEGRFVTCAQLPLPCVFYRPDDVEHATALTQDIGVTAWGLGVTGLSATALVRLREELGGAFTWPGSDDRFDALLAYAQYNRGIWRARLGRQQNLSGLGVHAYDGANLLVEPLARLSVEGYAGRSLGRGLLEPSNTALRGVEDFPIDTIGRSTYLFGASARYRPLDGTSMTVRYQREILGTRGALSSERASFDASTDAIGPVRVEAALDWDVAFNRMGKAHLRAEAPIRRNLILDATARRYRPFFELFTIWGFFSPVPYTEAELRATWLAQPELRVWATGAWRRYDESNAPIVLGGITRETTRGAVGSDWLVLPALGLQATYRFERGFGAFLSSAEATVRWAPDERFAVFVDGSATQQIEEFRWGDARVWGVGAGGELSLWRGMDLTGGAHLYRQDFDNRSSAADWNQRRAWLALRLGFGEDPGATRRPGRAR